MRRLWVVLVSALAVLLVAGGPALAEPPLGVTGRITDRVGALQGDEGRVTDAINALQRDKGVSLYVVYVAGFDGLTGEAWARQSAQQSSLGPDDVLLAIAVDERHYGVHRGDSVDQTRLRTVVIDDVQPKLSDSDWAGAAIALADGLGGNASTTSSGSNSGGGSGIATLVVVVVLIVGAMGGYLLVRSRRRRRELQPPPVKRLERPDPYAGTSTEELNGRASSALLDLDEGIRTSQVDLDYARSYFGEDAVAGLDERLAQSRDELSRAFTIRQQLDDEIPEDEPTRRRMLADLLGLTGAAGERLKAQAAALDELRERERTAPQAAEELGRRIAELQQRLPVQAQRVADLQRRYAPSAISAVARNVEEAGVRLAAAEQALGLARQDQAAGQAGRSVGRLRGAEEAAKQSGTLLDAIDRLADDLAAAEQRVPATRTEVEKDLAEARSLSSDGDRSGLRPQIARAEAALAAADAALRPGDGALPDPLAALRQLEESGTALDQALAVARDAQTQARRAAEALDQAMLAARSTVAAADDFISTRRGAVGSTARTRLAEARRHLDAAESLAVRDPVAALREAREAGRLAQYALDVAQDDVQRWSQQTGYGGYGAPGYGSPGFGGPGYGPGWGGAGYGRGGGISPLGAGIGGLLLGGLLFGGDHDHDGDWSAGDYDGGGGFGGDFGDSGGGGDFGGDF